MIVFFDGWLLPILYAIGCALTYCTQLSAKADPKRRQTYWTIAQATSGLALLGVSMSIVSAIISHQLFGANVDALGLAVAGLVALLGWIVTNYSMRYLVGEPNQQSYVRNLLLTIACISVLVTSANLLVMAVAWGATSAGLHKLLTFYSDRKAAQIVAHKKFIACRLADACMLIALILIFATLGTFSLEAIQTRVHDLHNANSGLPASMHGAMAFITLAAIIRTAQLPLHGWLIQVMEAPTPVSALLHAGIVNMGGFVLLRLADVLSLAFFSQALLVVVGSLTATIAGLVMMTRVSVKVRLAWSTCAQMGFMLLELGLGLYELALLHLLAHSFYKSYSFLATGDRVEQAKRRDFFAKPVAPNTKPTYPPQPVPQSKTRLPVLWYFTSALVSVALISISIKLWGFLLDPVHLSPTALAILALGFAPLLWFETTRSLASFSRGILNILTLTQLYLFWHLCFAAVTPQTLNPSDTAPGLATALAAWAILCVSILYGLQGWLRTYPTGRIASRLYPWAYCGFYLDELFTRLTFKIWPIRLTPVQAQTRVHRQSDHLGGVL